MLSLKQYPNTEERQVAMEKILIELTNMKNPGGKYISIPHLSEIGTSINKLKMNYGLQLINRVDVMF